MQVLNDAASNACATASNLFQKWCCTWILLPFRSGLACHFLEDFGENVSVGVKEQTLATQRRYGHQEYTLPSLLVTTIL